MIRLEAGSAAVFGSLPPWLVTFSVGAAVESARVVPKSAITAARQGIFNITFKTEVRYLTFLISFSCPDVTLASQTTRISRTIFSRSSYEVRFTPKRDDGPPSFLRRICTAPT